MAQYDKATARTRLLDLQRELQAGIDNRTTGDAEVRPQDPLLDSSGLVSDQADDADAMMDFERTRAETRNAQTLLAEVNAALERLDGGAYGTCAVCGRDIGVRRLEALPYATLCIDDQTAADARAAL
ncbi:MAG: TraR/DksA family transcriptional regulator [Ktedonobacterales bacterium]